MLKAPFSSGSQTKTCCFTEELNKRYSYIHLKTGNVNAAISAEPYVLVDYLLHFTKYLGSAGHSLSNVDPGCFASI